VRLFILPVHQSTRIKLVCVCWWRGGGSKHLNIIREGSQSCFDTLTPAVSPACVCWSQARVMQYCLHRNCPDADWNWHCSILCQLILLTDFVLSCLPLSEKLFIFAVHCYA